MKSKSTVTIGVDLGDKNHSICVLDSSGTVIDERSITNHRESLRRLSQKHPSSLIVFEVGTHSPWMSRFFEGLGHEVIVANARKVRAIYQSDRKCDKRDAFMLAKLARVDRDLLYPIQHRNEQAQHDLLQIKLRNSLVRRRVDLISSVRFTLKSLGVTLKSPHTAYFAAHTRRDLVEKSPQYLILIEPVLSCLDSITEQIKSLDCLIDQLAEISYPETQALCEITGVGSLTALTFVLTVGDPDRFAKARDIGPYLGLVPKRDQSGSLDKDLRISCAGDAYLRQLLVGSAQYILGPFGKECYLRERGLGLVERGGRRAKKKAVIATARKLAVMMLAILKSSESYDPERHCKAA